jgi:hypothetical protein
MEKSHSWEIYSRSDSEEILSFMERPIYYLV